MYSIHTFAYTSVYQRWCEKFGARINAKFSQLSWYYAEEGVKNMHNESRYVNSLNLE